MNYNLQAIQIKEEFSKEFEKTLKQLSNAYPRFNKGKLDNTLSESVAKMVVGTVLINVLKEMQVDGNNLVARQFHRKYVPNLPILDCSDFTIRERKEIIDDSPLTERDRKIAIKKFIENKSDTDIHIEMLEIESKKTITNNIENISDVIKHTACLYNYNEGNR